MSAVDGTGMLQKPGIGRPDKTIGVPTQFSCAQKLCGVKEGVNYTAMGVHTNITASRLTLNMYDRRPLVFLPGYICSIQWHENTI